MFYFIAILLLLGYLFDWCVARDRKDGRYGKAAINFVFYYIVLAGIYAYSRAVFEMIFDEGEIGSVLSAAAIIIVFLFIKNIPPRKWAR